MEAAKEMMEIQERNRPEMHGNKTDNVKKWQPPRGNLYKVQTLSSKRFNERGWELLLAIVRANLWAMATLISKEKTYLKSFCC